MPQSIKVKLGRKLVEKKCCLKCGNIHFRDGSMYTGEYLDSLENGVGMITYSNGDVIDANFVDGMIEGHGVLKYTNGDQREGFFNMNKLDGQVRAIYCRLLSFAKLSNL